MRAQDCSQPSHNFYAVYHLKHVRSVASESKKAAQDRNNEEEKTLLPGSSPSFLHFYSLSLTHTNTFICAHITFFPNTGATEKNTTPLDFSHFL